MLNFRNSIATRLALIYGFLDAASILVFAAIVYFGTIGVLNYSIDRKIRIVSDQLIRMQVNHPIEDILKEIDRQMVDGIDSDTEIFLLLAANGQRLGGNLSANLGRLMPFDKIITKDVVRSGKPIQARIMMRKLFNDKILVIGYSLQEQTAIRALVLHALGIGSIITVLLVVIGAFLFRHLLQRRIAEIRYAVKDIEAGNLHRRIQVIGDDEFSRLNVEINRMLDQIEHLMEGVRQVSNTIAHDLRTPLSRIHSKLNEAVHNPASTKASLSDAAIEAVCGIDELILLFDKLLYIAEAESGIRTQSFEEINLYRLAMGVVELYDAYAEENGVKLMVSGSVEVLAIGDRNLLANALANLIDNAIKYAGFGAKVEISVMSSQNEAVLVVRDNGFGIPPDELTRVMRRFYRLDRDRVIPGNGLGLAIASAIAKLHGGSLQLESFAGLTCRIVLPKCHLDFPKEKC